MKNVRKGDRYRHLDVSFLNMKDFEEFDKAVELNKSKICLL